MRKICEKVQEITPSKNMDQLRLEVFPKSKELEVLLKQAIMENELIFGMMTADRLQLITDAMKPRNLSPGKFLLTEGKKGSRFYITIKGEFEIFKGQIMLKRFDHVTVLGETAMLSKVKRFVSIKAVTSAKVYSLSRKVFDEIMTFTADAGKVTFHPTKRDEQVKKEAIEARRPLNVGKMSELNHIQLEDLTPLGCLGKGGYGKVDLVQYNNEKLFALKYLKKFDIVQCQQQKHVFNEKEVMLSCDCPFIVKLYRTFHDSRYLYFLMEPCLGGEVWKLLKNYKFFDEPTTKFFAACVTEALDYLHRRHIVYRDLKSENLMLDTRGYLKLVDFGFAKFLKPNEKTYTFVGTPEYTCPEIITNKGHNKSADYWSLGIFIFELLVGKPPFGGKNPMRIYNNILRGIVAVEFPLKVPKRAQSLIKDLCQHNPVLRLGNLKNGVMDIKNHSWFHDINWDKIRHQTFPSPFVPHIVKTEDYHFLEQINEDPPEETSGWDDDF
ncbi:cGMP-dependent protein kinase 1-like [Culicoides brevitarsis]|uniref:cGMP-dependent protein kinase 1-like n=1 Tax=Culicoides brevitarsis TaxID=469753 RepID=UPI00307B36B0